MGSVVPASSSAGSRRLGLALVLCGLALLCGCSSLCDAVDGLCIELRVVGSGRYNAIDVEWRYASSLYPIGAIVAGTLPESIELPRALRLTPPRLVPADALTDIGVRVASASEPDVQLAGSAPIVSPHDSHLVVEVPLSLKFKQVVLRSGGPFVLSSAPIDFNQDGLLDIVAANGSYVDATGKLSDPSGVSVHYQRADGSFAPATALASAMTALAPLVVANLDGNAANGPEIAVASFGSQVAIVRSDGSLFNPGLTIAGSARALVGAQLDNQGGTDLAVLGYVTTPSAKAQLSTWSFSAGAFAQRGTPLDVWTGNAPIRAVAADFDGNGSPDLAITRGGESGRGLIVVPNRGSFTFGPPVTYVDLGADPSALVAADLNADQRVDLVVASEWDQSVSVWLGSGSGSFTKQATAYLGTSFLSGLDMVAADFDGDGRIDIALGDLASSSVAILRGDGAGRLDAPIRFALGTSVRSLSAADLDRNGRPDLVLATTGGALLLFMNQPL